MSRRVPALPRLLLEDRLALLRALVALAWMLLAGLIAIQWLLRASDTVVWPSVAGFSIAYNAVSAVFALTTLVLTALLIYPNWFERVPREAESRVSWLLWLVLLWLGLHLFYLFHLSGGMHGPLLPLLPLLVLAALLILPGLGGWMLAVYLLGGQALVIALSAATVIHPSGELAEAFSLRSPGPPLGQVALAAVLALSLMLGLWARRWMYPPPRAGHPARRIDVETGLFHAHFLRERIRRELRRGARQRSASTLLVLDVRDSADSGAALPESSRDYARLLLKSLRLRSDTPAQLSPGRFGVLLPATDLEGAQALSRRLLAACEKAKLARPRIAGSVAASSSSSSAEQVIAAAESALSSTAADGGPHLVRV